MRERSLKTLKEELVKGTPKDIGDIGPIDRHEGREQEIGARREELFSNILESARFLEPRDGIGNRFSSGTSGVTQFTTSLFGAY